MTELPTQDVRPDPSGPWWKLRAAWTYAALLAGEMHDPDAEDPVAYAVWCESIGRLSLPGGSLVAGDPYVTEDEREPFVQRLGAQEVEVIAARAVISEGHERVAALVLLVGSHPIVEWAMATVPGEDVSAIQGEEVFGYGVDAGTGAFGSVEAMQTAERVLDADAGMLEDPVSTALLSDGGNTRSAFVVAPEAGAVPVAVCSSGWGDGIYPTWLGLDESGDVMVVVTDFTLTGGPASPTPPAPGPDESRPKSLFRRLFSS